MVDKCTKVCMHFWRLAFIILNSLFIVIGLALIGLAIYLLATQNDLTVLTGNRFASGGVLILIAGLITTIISFVGVLGAIGMWPVLLIIYVVLLFVIVALEIAAGVLGFVYRTQLVGATEIRSKDAIQQYREPEDEEFRSDINAVLDFLQIKFRCCGYVTPFDWESTPYFNSTGRYPDSCNCSLSEATMSSGESMCSSLVAGSMQLVYDTSCNVSLNAFIQDNLAIVGGVGIAFGVFEIIGIALAVALTICFFIIKRGDQDDFKFNKAI